MTLPMGQQLPEPLDPEEERKAVAALDGEEAERARALLIEHNLRLAAYLAQKFARGWGMEEELLSVTTIGLIKAVQSYRPEKEVQLATYAVRCMKNEIYAYLRQSRAWQPELLPETPACTDTESGQMDVRNRYGTEADATYGEVEKKARRYCLKNAIDKLSVRERRILRLRYGFDSADGSARTQREVAAALQVSQSYVSRTERQILAKLRAETADWEDCTQAEICSRHHGIN